MQKLITRLCKEEDGATAVEYGIMVAAIAAVIIGVVIQIGTKTDAAFDKVNDADWPGAAAPAGG